MIINLETQLDSLFSPWKKDFCPGLQVLIRHHGRDVYEKCFGLANMEYRILVIPETIFHVASISKQFTVRCFSGRKAGWDLTMTSACMPAILSPFRSL